MTQHEHGAAVRAIGELLLTQWDPLGVHHQPGPHEEYTKHAQAVYGLLARGASSAQVIRYLHSMESGELQHPELAAADLSGLLRALRTVNLDT
ncbi:MAG: hypothetical protein ABJE47_18690 [bacterium]